MKLACIIGMQTLISKAVQADGGDAHGYGGMTPIPTFHPPSAKNPIRVKVPSPADGWHDSDSSASKLQARKDLMQILKRTGRQPGSGANAYTAIVPWYPVQ